ncbi:MAG TPA: HD domain-containing protein [Nitrososphaeraceae archaeon]|nr:HD domain-containing protein [Nitrososphaeraceae archaeon]
MYTPNHVKDDNRIIDISNSVRSNNESHDVDIDTFIQSIFRLKKIKRTGWLAKGKILDGESIADHSYSLSALCMVFSDILGLDTGKVMKMCIIHDLAESIIGDIMPGEIPEKEKKMKETKVMESILFSLPVSVRIDYIRIWKEFLLNGSQEAQLVHKVDKLEMLLQAREYLLQGYSIRYLEQFFKSIEKYCNQEDNPSLYGILGISNTLKNLKYSLDKK